MFETLFQNTRDVLEPIDRIINAVYTLAARIFRLNIGNGSLYSDSFMKMVVDTIVGNPYLLISVSLLFCGFILGILKRMITS